MQTGGDTEPQDCPWASDTETVGDEPSPGGGGW